MSQHVQKIPMYSIGRAKTDTVNIAEIKNETIILIEGNLY